MEFLRLALAAYGLSHGDWLDATFFFQKNIKSYPESEQISGK